ncbi:phosphonate C-P lyase system protein PhnG [Paracoccus sp. (in: a-proteobacteria)]|uniref:phosphonate C-P lyase system protein PhnG n=1 Tax=Paracoccus sp. TaxID=267 RepID=UPI0026E0E428|nr:phosphonate C-P lyase system protein PhnG [Paracoccus sp. (in: a-proteobacteria)]MDO5648288.1 phosphonate C-P lyase system protein PhnG [Paracoccus sp. (in: a-proteobacteria)]
MSAFSLHDRRDWMSRLATTSAHRLAGLLPDLPPHHVLRGPEIGTVMVQGRISATGAPFNVGEITVTRCSVELDCGTVGHAHVQGRSRDHATRAAIIDALMQTDAAPRIRPLIDALTQDAAATRDTRARRAAATRVEFFTLQRGED